MNKEIINRLTEILVQRFYRQGFERFNLDKEMEVIIDPVMDIKPNVEEKNEIEKRVLKSIKYKRAYGETVLKPISVVSDPKEHEEWYEEWLRTSRGKGAYYWDRQEDYLERVLTPKYGPENAAHIIKSIDASTNEIMKKMANPERSEFSYKGLVVGYVQSGKTANFTALISKAADAGYKFIIVFSGIHNVLRKQTQIRLDKELTGINDLGIKEEFIDQPSDLKSWHRMTSALDNGEFETNYPYPFNYLCRSNKPTLAVTKKNCRVMDKLIKYIKGAKKEDLDKMSLLIIDDEADQASIDTNYSKDTDPSKTNEKLRTLLELFSRKAYVGYTATPFANVLVDMTTEHEKLRDDIYPRNFIVSLPEPTADGYLGASAIFAGELSDMFVAHIPDERNILLYEGNISKGLANAIDEFILCCGVCNLRGHRMKSMSMLVHVSHRIEHMANVKNIIEDYCYIQNEKLRDPMGREKLKKDYKDIWSRFSEDSNVINRKLDLYYLYPNFTEIWKEVEEMFNNLKVLELNSSSEDILDYSSGKGIKVIAVGGNQLSRGLTLEGLMTSYYLRESKQYDTLLQMGRWFGYRLGYEDLTRIYTTEKISSFFEHLSLVEEELRGEISRYEEEQKTPAEMAIAIKAHTRLNITARNKMGAARAKQISYSKSLSQTTWLPLDNPEILKANYALGETFIAKINKESGFSKTGNVYLSKKYLSGQDVLKEFLGKYKFIDKESIGGPGLDYKRMLEYICRRINDNNPELQDWKVGVITRVNPKENIEPLIYGELTINRIQRSRKHTEKGYNIGVLTEPEHLVIDLAENVKDPYEERSPQNPLLLLYLLWAGSKARTFLEKPAYGQRIDLYRFIESDKIDVLGFGLVLPRSDYEPTDYIGQ